MENKKKKQLLVMPPPRETISIILVYDLFFIYIYRHVNTFKNNSGITQYIFYFHSIKLYIKASQTRKVRANTSECVSQPGRSHRAEEAYFCWLGNRYDRKLLSKFEKVLLVTLINKVRGNTPSQK